MQILLDPAKLCIGTGLQRAQTNCRSFCCLSDRYSSMYGLAMILHALHPVLKVSPRYSLWLSHPLP